MSSTIKIFSLILVAVFGIAFEVSDTLKLIIGSRLAIFGTHIQETTFNHQHWTSNSNPQQIWQDVLDHNLFSVNLRHNNQSKTTPHPLVAIVHCMDNRLNTNELLGDNRHLYYVVRTAGSTLDIKEEEMLELAVKNGVKLIVFTTHSDCAAEKIASDPIKQQEFPALAEAVRQRESRFHEFLAKPMIAQKIKAGELLVKWIDVDTNTEKFFPHKQ